MISPSPYSQPENSRAATGVLFSGGLDSSILTAHLLDQGRIVRPFYIRCDLVWETCERSAADSFLDAVRSPRLQELVELELPLLDLYHEHWSITGECTPRADSPDEAVFLPGRNALLTVKAAIWCQLHGLRRLALAPLGTSPFPDASREFFDRFASALNTGGGPQLEIICPFEGMNKRQVMRLGRKYPLEFSFSCISPTNSRHCGTCNKCAERQSAFRSAGLPDPTTYAVDTNLVASKS